MVLPHRHSRPHHRRPHRCPHCLSRCRCPRRVLVDEGFVAAFAAHIASSSSLCRLASSSSPPVVVVVDGIIVITISLSPSHRHPPRPLPSLSSMKASWHHWLHTSLRHCRRWDCCHHCVIVALSSLGVTDWFSFSYLTCASYPTVV